MTPQLGPASALLTAPGMLCTGRLRALRPTACPVDDPLYLAVHPLNGGELMLGALRSMMLLVMIAHRLVFQRVVLAYFFN
jgi:hypothetical protein